VSVKARTQELSKMQGENLSKGSGNKISLVLFKKEPNNFPDVWNQQVAAAAN